MNRYFFYDPHGGFEFFATQDACLQTARNAIRLYILENDGPWPEDKLAGLRMGIVTHTAQPINVVQKPPEDQLDSNGYDAEGIQWTGEGSHCDYEMLPVEENP